MISVIRELAAGMAGFLRTLSRKIHFDLFLKKYKKEIQNPDILISDFLIGWREFIHDNGETYEDALAFSGIIQKSKQVFNNVKGIDIDTTHKIRSYTETNKKFEKSDDWVCFEQFFTFKNIFLALFLKIKKCFGYNIGERYESFLEVMNSTSYNYIFSLITTEHIIKKVKPKCFFLSCEYNNTQRAITHIARLQNILVFAIQHGVIHPTHYGYILDKKYEGKILLPDITFVSGQYQYDMLTKNSIYQPDQVVITGQPRYDILFHAQKVYPKKDFCKRYKIPMDHKIILWTTQCNDPDVTEEEKIETFGVVFETMKYVKNATLIVKQHKGEAEKYTQMIKKYLEEYNINAHLAPKESEACELEFICDVMITRNSTTGMEAIALNRPLIVLNLSGLPDVVDYVEQGVAIGVYKKEDLKKAIEKLLQDSSELEKNRDNYVRKYLHKIDGKSTERVVNFIKKELEETEKE